jgi:hypothetical protein
VVLAHLRSEPQVMLAEPDSTAPAPAEAGQGGR